jgi:hypothetical protein
MKEQSLASQVSMDDVVFQAAFQRSGNRVSYAPSQGLLHFNTNVTEILGILKGKQKWEQVKVGISPSTGILILKKCDPETYGCSLLRTDTGTPGSFSVNISHLIKNHNLKAARAYKYEKAGDVIYLQADNETLIDE